jgi:imidazolonepropionase
MEFDLIIRNATLACMTEARPYGLLEQGAVGVKDGKIAWLGHDPDFPVTAPACPLIDAMGMVVTPGLVDCHTHVVHVGDGLLDFELKISGASRDEIAAAGGGVGGLVARSRAASEEQLYAETAPRIRAMIASGITTLESKSGLGLDLSSELSVMRVSRALSRDFPLDVQSTFLGAHGVAPEYQGRADDYIDFLIARILPAALQQGLVDAVDGFCDTIGFSPAQMTRLFEAAHSHGLPVKLHADQYTDAGAGQVVARFNGLSADHLEYASKATIAAMAEAGVVAGLLPGANWMLRETRMPPVHWMRELGVDMALATNNNPISSPVTMPTMMMNMGCVRFGLTAEEAVAAFTRVGAKALGLAADRGTLEAGKMADLVLWDVTHPAELPYRIAHNPCHTTIKAGAICYQAEPVRLQ